MQIHNFFISIQKKNVIQGTIVTMLPFLLFCVVACSGFPLSVQQSKPTLQQTRILTNRINPCSLVSKIQVEQVLHTAVTVRQPQGYLGTYGPLYSCTYESPSNVYPHIYVDVVLSTYKDVSQARADLQRVRSVLHAHDLSGQAILTSEPSVLFAQKDNGIVSISVTGDDPKIVEHQEQRIAEFALQNM